MSVRRQQNENSLGVRRPHVVSTGKKVMGGNENTLRATPAVGKSILPASSSSKNNDDKSKTLNDKSLATTRRPALTSLTNGTPSQSKILRQPLSSKPVSRQPLTTKKAAIPLRPAIAKTPSTKPKKALSVYTPGPASKHHGAVVTGVGEVDEVEYMRPKPAEIPYQPLSPMRRSTADDDLFTLHRNPVVELDLQLPEDSIDFKLDSFGSPARPAGGGHTFDLDEPEIADFQFDV